MQKILENHALWLACEGGERANFSYADLSYANFSYADLSYANFSYANLRGANFSYADLRGANLTGVVLWNTIGDSKYIKNLHCNKYNIAYTSDRLQIGCENHSIEDWYNYSDKRIACMDKGALAWWKIWKPVIFNLIELSPAE